jgi:hypothetical protein
MKKSKIIFFAVLLVLVILPIGGCENFTESDEINYVR